MENIIEKFAKINMLNISNAELVRWLRSNVITHDNKNIDLTTAYSIAKILKETHRLGVIRGQLLGPE